MALNVDFDRRTAFALDTNSTAANAQGSRSGELTHPTVADEMMPSEEQKDLSSVSYCHYNYYEYDCGCVEPGSGPHVKHVNCSGKPLGQTWCDNMNPVAKYPKIKSRCRNCIRGNVLVAEARSSTELTTSIHGHPPDELTASFVSLDMKDAETNHDVHNHFNISGELRPLKSDLRRMSRVTRRSHIKKDLSQTTVHASVVNEKNDEERRHAKHAHKVNLLHEQLLIKIQLESVRDQLASAEASGDQKAAKVYERKMTEMQEQSETLAIEIALLEKPPIAWQSQGEIIEASSEARAIMNDEAEKEAVSFLPRLRCSRNLVAYAKAFGAVGIRQTAKDGLAVKETFEEGWDMVDEFEGEDDWVDLPDKRLLNKS